MQLVLVCKKQGKEANYTHSPAFNKTSVTKGAVTNQAIWPIINCASVNFVYIKHKAHCPTSLAWINAKVLLKINTARAMSIWYCCRLLQLTVSAPLCQSKAHTVSHLIATKVQINSWWHQKSHINIYKHNAPF